MANTHLGRLEAEQFENLAKVLYMSVYIRTKDEDVVNIDKTEWKVT